MLHCQINMPVSGKADSALMMFFTKAVDYEKCVQFADALTSYDYEETFNKVQACFSESC